MNIKDKIRFVFVIPNRSYKWESNETNNKPTFYLNQLVG